MTMVMDQPSAFGDLLKQYRMARGLTQIALADRVRLSVRGISDIERGVHRTPQTETVRRLSDALRLSPQERAALDAAIQRFRVLSASSSSVLPSSAASCPASPTRRAECLATRSPRQASGASSPPFVGRADELALVQGHLAGVGPPLLVLEGEPGIGKSRLLEEAGVCARDMGMRALDGGCRRGGGQEPYAPLPDILERHIYRQAPVCCAPIFAAAPGSCACCLRSLRGSSIRCPTGRSQRGRSIA